MHKSNDLAEKLASKLLQINAIKLSPTNYFTWASGIKSPIYCDNRQTLAFPEIRTQICDGFAKLIGEKYPQIEYVAGVATGAIAHGMLVADRLKLPYVYVRPKPKEHGLGNQIEGLIDKGKRVVVIEDLISTGGSSIKAVNALREAGFQVLGLMAIFTYGFDVATAAFEKSNCEYNVLTDYNTLLSVALKNKYINHNEEEQLTEWRKTINK